MQITLSFLATTDEIIDWTTQFIEGLDLHFALIQFPPWKIAKLAAWSGIGKLIPDPKVLEVWISHDELVAAGKTQSESASQNPEHLFLKLPETRPDGLREGWMGIVTEDARHLKLCRAMIRFFKKRMQSGVWVQNPQSKAKGFYKNNWYSPDIAELHRNGLQLLVFAGGNLIFIDEPVS